MSLLLSTNYLNSIVELFQNKYAVKQPFGLNQMKIFQFEQDISKIIKLIRCKPCAKKLNTNIK